MMKGRGIGGRGPLEQGVGMAVRQPPACVSDRAG
jgi:hypothetical protein